MLRHLTAGALLCAASALSLAPPALSAQPAIPAAPAPAAANQDILIAPQPAWVVAPSSEPSATSDAAMRLLDIQARMDDRGSHLFSRSVIKLTNSAELQKATNLIVQWQPELGGATIHTARILRDGKVIDLLTGTAKFNTLRQEAGLQMGRLDGILTAVLPVADLRIGDELELSYTLDQRNSALRGHGELENLVPPDVKIGVLHLRYSWPKNIPMQIRFGSSLPKPTQETAGGIVAHRIEARDFTLPAPHAGAPERAITGLTVQLGDFRNWGEVAATMLPLFERASVLPAGSPVQAEIDRISAAAPDPLKRAAAALRLVQRDVRYFADVRGLAGYVPMAADDVWQRRIGDCKGKTVLLLAMLKGLGIEAEAVLVSAGRGNGLNLDLPAPGRFDHVLVRARIGGQTYWLDGTQMDEGPLESQIPPPFEWGLPLREGAAELVAIPLLPYREAQTEWRLDLDARAGLDAPAKATASGVLRGSQAQWLSAQLMLLDGAKQQELVRTIWRNRHDWLTIDKVTYEIDRDKGEVRLGLTGSGTMDWDRTGDYPTFRYEANKARLGADISRNRQAELPLDAVLVVPRRFDTIHQTILLPPLDGDYRIEGETIDETIGGIHYRRTATLTGTRFDMTSTTSSGYSEITVKLAKAADAVSDKLAEKALYVGLPVAARGLAADDPARVGEKVQKLVQNREFGPALKIVDEALAGKPGIAWLHHLRGLILAAQNDAPAADRAFDTALALDSKLVPAILAKAQILAGKGRFSDALLLVDRAILVQPDQVPIYLLRAQLRNQVNDTEGALSDYAIVAAKEPGNPSRTDQVRLLSRLGRKTEAAASAKAFYDANSSDPTAFALYANTLLADGKRVEAAKLLDEAQAISPRADVPILRLTYDLIEGPDARLKEMLSAVALDPARPLPMDVLSPLKGDQIRLSKVLAAYEAAIAKAGEDKEKEPIQFARATVLAATGDPSALADFYRVLETRYPENATMRNNSCWERATRRIDLAGARASCLAAIAIRRDPGFVDSLAMVELQSGNNSAAIKAYDEAIVAMPASATSLFGRGIAKLRSGDKVGGTADLTKAREIDPRIAETFERYGLLP